MWQSKVVQHITAHPAFDNLTFEQQSDESLVLVDLLPRVKQAVKHLESVAYPDARDLEPDPDIELPATLKKARWRRLTF